LAIGRTGLGALRDASFRRLDKPGKVPNVASAHERCSTPTIVSCSGLA